jgi:integrase
MGVYKRGKNYFIDYYAGPKRFKEMVGPNRREAKAALGKKLGLIREGKFFEIEKVKEITFDDMADKFSDWLKANRKSEDYKYTLTPAREHFKGRLLAGITEEEIEAYRAQRKEIPTKADTEAARRPRSNSTLNHELSIVKQLFSKAIAWGYLGKGKNPADGVKKLSEPKGRIRYLTAEEVKALLEAASDHLQPILVCALETGMRRGEILSLTWKDVDFKNGTLYIAAPKNGDPRHVPMSARLHATLKALPRRLRINHVFTGSIRTTPAAGKRKRPLNQSIGKVGEPFQDVDTSFEKACAKAGIEGFRFHDLRHTAASHMIMAGVPFRTVGEILGHKTAAMTERYSHLSPEHKRNAVEMLSASLREDSIGPQSVPERKEATGENL